MAALYVILNNTLAIRAGNIHITFASLPVVVTALLFGPVQAAVTALLGELMNQLYLYGISITTPLWLIPPVLRGLVIGTAALWAQRAGRPLEQRPILGYGVCILAALLTTIANTAVIAADALIFHYYTWVYVFGKLVQRLVSGMAIAVCVATVALPLTAQLRQMGLTRKTA
jgi:uncharacterized membrane protein